MKPTLDHILLALAGLLLVIAWVAVITLTGSSYWSFDGQATLPTPVLHSQQPPVELQP